MSCYRIVAALLTGGIFTAAFLLIVLNVAGVFDNAEPSSVTKCGLFLDNINGTCASFAHDDRNRLIDCYRSQLVDCFKRNELVVDLNNLETQVDSEGIYVCCCVQTRSFDAEHSNLNTLCDSVNRTWRVIQNLSETATCAFPPVGTTITGISVTTGSPTCQDLPCQNNGTCATVGDTIVCLCQEGYSGQWCETDLICGESNPCQNGAVCRHSTSGAVCDCGLDLVGTFCQIIRCGGVFIEDYQLIQSSLLNEGLLPIGTECVYRILAPESYVIKVQFDHFQLPSVVGDIDCRSYLAIYDSVDLSVNFIDRFCASTSRLSYISRTNASTLQFVFGSNAESTDVGYRFRYVFGADQCTGVSCPGNRICLTTMDDRFECVCVLGYTGSDCETIIDNCASHPCQNGGHCINSLRNYTCLCATGYTGRNCQSIIDNCLSSPCSNGGSCVNRVGDYQCNCLTYFYGKNCQKVNCTGITTTELRGTISSPGFPDSNYPPNADCLWTVLSRKKTRFSVNLTMIMIEGPYEHCQYDYLEIHDGNQFNRRICGVDLNHSSYHLPLISSDTVVFKFRSDNTVQTIGFSLDYAEVNADDPIDDHL